MADGDITLTVTLDTTDIKARSAQLQSEISKIFDNASSGKLNANMKQILLHLDKLSNRADAVRARMQAMEETKVANPSIQVLEEQMVQLEQRIEEFRTVGHLGLDTEEAKAKLQEMNDLLAELGARYNEELRNPVVSLAEVDPEQYAKLHAQLGEINNEMAVTVSQANQMGSSGVQSFSQFSSILDTMTTSFANVQQASEQSNSSVARIGATVQGVGSIMSSFGSQAGGVVQTVGQGISRVGNAISTVHKIMSQVGQRILSVFKSIGKAVAGVVKAVHKVASVVGTTLAGAFNKVKNIADRTFSFKNLTNGIKKIAMLAVGVQGVTAVFNKLKGAIKEGLNNLVQYQSKTNETNQAMSQLQSSLLYMKNAWASAFAPIINVVMPYLTALIDKIAVVANSIARFTGALTGQKTVLNAVKVSTGDYAKGLTKASKSAGGAGKAVKKLSDRLASFDDLNVLGKDNDNAGAGGGGAGGLGGLDGLDPNKMFKKVSAKSNLAEMLKKAWESGDFTDLGKLVGEKITTALNNIPWGDIQATARKIGKSVATFLNGALGDPAIWEAIGKTIAEGLNTATQAINGFLMNSDVDFGGGFATLINKFFETFDWNTFNANITLFGQDLVDNINSFFSTLDIGEISADIGSVAQSITTFLVNLATEIDWNAVADAFVGIGGAILAGIQKGFEQSDNPIMQSLGELIGSITETLSILLPVIQQIVSAISPVITAILPVISAVLPQIATIISDVATLVLPIVVSLIQALMPIIQQLIEAILPVLQTILVALQPVFQTLIESVLPVFLKVLGLLMPLIETILECVSELIVPIIGLISPLLELVTAIISPLLDFLTPIISIIRILLSLVVQILSPIIELISPLITIITSCLSPIFELFGVIGDILEAVLIPLLSLISNLIKTVVIPIFKALTVGIGALSGVFKTVADGFSWLIGIIKIGAESLGKILKGWVNGILTGFEKFVNGIISGLNFAIRSMNKLSFDVPDWVPSIGGKKFGFNIKELATVKLPRLAEGAVIPPNREFMAVLGDQSHGTNVEAPLDTIKQAVADVMGSGNAEVVQLLQQLIGVVESKNLVIGDKEIAKANARYNNQQRLIRGASF